MQRKHRKSQSQQAGEEETPNQSENEEELFQDSNDADSETSLFDRPDCKGSVDFTRTVRATGSSYGLSNKAQIQIQPGGEAKKDKMATNGGTNHEMKSERTKHQDNPPEIDTDEETDNLVGRIKGIAINENNEAKIIQPSTGETDGKTNNIKVRLTLTATSSENINGNSSETANPPSSSDSCGSSSKLSEQQTSKQNSTKQEYVACNGIDSSAGDSTGSSKDNDLASKAKNQATKDDISDNTEATKSSIACGFTAAKLAKQEDISPPVSPASPTRSRVMSTLAPRYQGKSLECSVESCLSQFTVPEWLTGTNKFGCENCSKNSGN